MALEIMCALLYTSCYRVLKFEYILCKNTPRLVTGSEKYNFPINRPVRNISWLYVKVWLG